MTVQNRTTLKANLNDLVDSFALISEAGGGASISGVYDVKSLGAVGDGVTNDTVAIQAAIDNPAVNELVFTSGTYMVSNIAIATASNVTKVRGVGNPTIRVLAGASATGLSVTKLQYLTFEGIKLASVGSANDGNNVTGLKFQNSTSYHTVRDVAVSGFSGAGIQANQCIYHTYEDIQATDCKKAIWLRRNGAYPCTTVTIDGLYASSCLNAVKSSGTTNMVIRSPITEYCGASATVNGALQFNGGFDITIQNPYYEANQRNLVINDAAVLVEHGGGTTFQAAAADSVSYSGLATDLRGTAKYRNNRMEVAKIDYDSTSNLPCTIGTNLVVPTSAGSVQFGCNETITVTGTATNATWTTVRAFPSTEMTGQNNQKAFYQYVIEGGISDLSTGFDAGTIYNGTLRSYSGTTPTWLRLSSNNLQVNLTSSSYGLLYKLCLNRIQLGNP